MLNPISYKPIDKNIYVIKDESTFIDSNFDNCQINYYSISNNVSPTQSFSKFILKNPTFSVTGNTKKVPENLANSVN